MLVALFAAVQVIVQLKNLCNASIYFFCPQEKLQELLDKANHCIEQPGGNSQGLKLLIEALYMCKEYKLIQEAASVHRDCAKLLLQTESYTLAYRHADASIKIQPDCDMVTIIIMTIYSFGCYE